jgi:K+-transporting ATPase KdpF subunit
VCPWAIFSFWRWVLARSVYLRPTPPSARGSDAMPDLILGGVVAAGLFAYLIIALLAPERF